MLTRHSVSSFSRTRNSPARASSVQKSTIRMSAGSPQPPWSAPGTPFHGMPPSMVRRPDQLSWERDGFSKLRVPTFIVSTSDYVLSLATHHKLRVWLT